MDTLLIALYVEIDDHVISAGRPGCGQPRKLSDAELVCLAVAQALLAHAARAGSLRPGLTLIGDKGFAGSGFEDLAATGGITHLGVCPFRERPVIVRMRPRAVGPDPARCGKPPGNGAGPPGTALPTTATLTSTVHGRDRPGRTATEVAGQPTCVVPPVPDDPLEEPHRRGAEGIPV